MATREVRDRRSGLTATQAQEFATSVLDGLWRRNVRALQTGDGREADRLFREEVVEAIEAMGGTVPSGEAR